MTSEAYEDLGGMSGVPSAYSECGAWWRVCPYCGAGVEERCTFETEVYEPGRGLVPARRFRSMPCIARQTGKQ